MHLIAVARGTLMWKVDTTLSGEGNETLTKGPLILQCVRTPSGSYRVYLKVFGAVLNTHWKAQTLEKAKDLAETLLAEVKNNGDENASRSNEKLNPSD